MSKPTPFVLPTGISLAIGGNSLVIRHAGDVVLEQTLGRRLSRVEAGGDLTLRLSPINGVLRAEGTLTIQGDVDAQELRGDIVVIDEVKVRARVIVATTRVIIGKAHLAVDVIVAPEILIAPNAQGRVRIIDCLNERAPSRVRGCLSLQDYETDFGGAAEFLARRGITPVSPLPMEHQDLEMDDVVVLDEADFGADQEPDAERDTMTVTAIDEVEDDEEDEHPTMHIDTSSLVAARPAEPEVEEVEDSVHDLPSHALEAVTIHEDEDEDEDEPEAVVQAEPPRPRRHRPVSGKLTRALDRIMSSYDHPPEPALRVAALLGEGDLDALDNALDGLWIQLVRHHIAIQQPPPRTAVQGFHQLHSLLG